MKKSKLSRMLAAFLVLVMVLTMLPGTALAIEIDLQADETAPCQITEGCILADGHEGDCVVEEEPAQAPKAVSYTHLGCAILPMNFISKPSGPCRTPTIMENLTSWKTG